MAAQYVSSAQYALVPQWAALTTYAIGAFVRQLAVPAVGSERVWRASAITTGISSASEPTWTLTAGAATVDSGVTWTEVTGQQTHQISGNWKAPHARLQNAFAAGWATADDSVYVGHDHAQTQASALTLTAPARAKVFCVSVAGSVPPVQADLRATASITTTGASAITMLTTNSEYNGFTFNAGSGATSAQIVFQVSGLALLSLRNCNLRKLGTVANAVAIWLGQDPLGDPGKSRVILENVTAELGNTSDSIYFGAGSTVWKNTSSPFLTGVIPTNFAVLAGAVTVLENVNMSPLGTGKNIVKAATAGESSQIWIRNCLLGSGVTLSATQPIGATIVYLMNSDSSATNYRNEKYMPQGIQVTETTIVRTGGFSIKGLPVSMKITTNSLATPVAPFECSAVIIPDNDVIGTPITINLQCRWGSGVTPTNADIYFICEYMGSTASPIGSVIGTGRSSLLGVAVPYGAGSGVWGGGVTSFVMTVTITAQLKGPIFLYPYVAKASDTFYIDPLPLVT